MISPNRRLLVGLLFLMTIRAIGQESAQQTSSAFGTLKESQTGEAALIGTFYDLKQTVGRQSTGINPGTYLKVVRGFLMSGWSEKYMARFYRAPKTITATSIFVPVMGAQLAPQAFEVEKTVKPNCWFIHYRAEVVPPEDGTFRFVGGCDDVIAIAVDDELVLAGGRPGILENLRTLNWQKGDEAGKMFQGYELYYGNWVDFKKSQPRTVDILIGERPGSAFGAGVLIQKQGETYASDKWGNPILPVFQVAPGKIPSTDSRYTPEHQTDISIWKALQ